MSIVRSFVLFALIIVATKPLCAQLNLDSLYAIWKDPAQSDSLRAAAFVEYVSVGFLPANSDTVAILADELIAFGIKQAYPRAQASGFNIKGRYYFGQGDYSKALYNYSQCYEICERFGIQKGKAVGIINMGLIYRNQGDYLKAHDCFSRGIKIYEHLGDQKGMCNALVNIGTLYSDQGENLKALDCYTKGLTIAEQQGDQKEMASALNNIGIIYHDQGDYSKALEYYSQGVKIRDQLGDQDGMALGLNNIGLIYYDQGDYTKAFDYYFQSLKIFERLGNQEGKASLLNNIGSIYKVQGDYPKALDHYFECIKIREQLGDQPGMASAFTNIGMIYHDQGKNLKALDYCQKSYQLALSIGSLSEQRDACQCLYDTYKFMGKGSEALIYLEKINVINDSLKSEETAKQLQQMEFKKVMLQDSIAKAEEARLIEEAHKEEVRQKNQTRNWLIVAAVFSMLLAGGLFGRWRYVKRSKAILQVEKDRSENLLLNILPADIAEELKQKGKAEARDFDMVSIIFTDFKGFTEQSAKLSASDLVDEINVCFEAFDGIMARHHIEKIKTIGDAYMAAGGLPVPSDSSVKNTILAALEMQAFITHRKAQMEAQGKPAFEMRVGIHTGPVVAGIVGVKKFQYDIWGDTVNTASRMESSGETGKVNISQSTYELVKDDPDLAFEARGKISAKGKGEMEMYFVKLSEQQ